MVVMGRHRGNGKALANYLLSTAANDNVKLFDIRGTADTEDIQAALLEMSLTAELTRSNKGLYHVQLNPAYGEDRRMTAEDWLKAAEILEKQTGFENQKRVIVLHQKHGRIHAHLVYERYCHDTGKMISDSFSRLAQDRARKEMEMSFSHRRTPHRSYERPEIKKVLSTLWVEAKTAQEFIQKAEEFDYRITSSQSRRPYMVIDSNGRSFDLVRQLTGIRTRQVRERLQDIKLEKDKTVIRRIRDKISEKNIDDIQELSLDKILKQKSAYDARQDELALFKEKMSLMKSNKRQLEADTRINPVTTSQKKLAVLRGNYRKSIFDDNAGDITTEIKKETPLEKALRELKKSMEQAEERQKKRVPTLSL